MHTMNLKKEIGMQIVNLGDLLNLLYYAMILIMQAKHSINPQYNLQTIESSN